MKSPNFLHANIPTFTVSRDVPVVGAHSNPRILSILGYSVYHGTSQWLVHTNPGILSIPGYSGYPRTS